MSLRRRFRNLRAVTPFVAVLIAVAWVSGAAAVECPEVVFFRVADQFISIGWTMGIDEHEVDDFGGYRVWMREVWQDPDPSPESFSLIREYVLDEDDPFAAGYWPFGPYYEQPTRADSADIFANAFPYEFAVTAFSAADPQAINYECIDATRTGVIYPRVGTQSDLSSVRCLPNPYRASADWEYGGQKRVTFIGLPARATIRIYSTSADHVRTLTHADDQSDLEFWDLRNSDGEEIAPGVYLYLITSGSETIDGKVMIIK